MYYTGADYHRKYSRVTVVDEEGEVVKSGRLDNRPEAFKEFFGALDGPTSAVLEATRTRGAMFDLLEGLEGVESVALAHPLKVRAAAEAKIKTDKMDAHTLAQLLRADLIPAAYIPGKDTRLLKEMVRQRVFLVRMRTRLKNRHHVLLDRLHVPMPPVTDIFGKRGTDYLKGLGPEGIDGEILRENLELLKAYNGLIKEAEAETGRLLGEDPRVRLLRTVPGVGPVLAAVIALEIDDIGRFGSPAKLASYAGLVPSTYASGGKAYNGRLIHMSNKWLRRALVEAAWVSVRTSPYRRSFFEGRKRRKGANTAAIALAGRIGDIIWHVLKEKRPYGERPVNVKRRTFEKAASPAALATL